MYYVYYNMDIQQQRGPLQMGYNINGPVDCQHDDCQLEVIRKLTDIRPKM